VRSDLFGCLGKVHFYRKGSQKLSSKPTPCVLLCTLNHRNYRLYDLKARKVLTAWNALFTENIVPVKSANTPGESDLGDASSDSSSGSDISRIVVTGTDSESDDSSPSDSSDTQDLDVSLTTSEETEIEQSSSSDSESEDAESADQTSGHEAAGAEPLYPSLEHNPPSRWGTWVPSARQTANVCHGVTPHPPVKHSCHATGLEEFDNPTLQQELSSSQKQQWIEAISEELESLLEVETWDAVPHAPPGKRVFPSKFVLKVRRNSDRTIERYKARLDLLGHLQRQNIYIFETYSPVVDLTATRIALTVACQERMAIHHLYVKCAFLYGYLDEEIYMRLPQEYQSPDGSVCRLKRSIYGLKQAPRAWNARLTDDLKRLGYQPFLRAECIYWREKEGIKVFLLIYVDDLDDP
jgi:hypothetical protein